MIIQCYYWAVRAMNLRNWSFHLNNIMSENIYNYFWQRIRCKITYNHFILVSCSKGDIVNIRISWVKLSKFTILHIFNLKSIAMVLYFVGVVLHFVICYTFCVYVYMVYILCITRVRAGRQKCVYKCMSLSKFNRFFRYRARAQV